MDNIKITVCTPTYNRAYCLPQLYESLKRQHYRKYEWVVVDDGSADRTRDLITQWEKENLLSIRYYYQHNGGKHRAVNHGLDVARGKIFFVVDSDDYLTDDALEKLDKWFEQIKDYPEIVGVVGNKGYRSDYTPNPPFAEAYLDKTFLDMGTYQENGKYVIGGERAIALYTDIYRKYRYPEFTGERFVTEAVAYNRIAHAGYKVRFFNDIIWIFSYREDGLTKSGQTLYLHNPQGYGLWLRERAEFLGYSLKQKMKIWYTYYCDLSTCDDDHRVTKKACASYIGAPISAIYIAAAVHKVRRVLRRK